MKHTAHIRMMGLLWLLLMLWATGAALADGALMLPAATREIADEAFYGAASVTDVTLPDGVARIGTRAFMGSGLKRINLPESLTYIAPNAFDGLNLERAQVKVGSYAAEYCKAQGIACDSPAILESAHPYADDADQTWTWTGDADTVWLEVIFSQDTELENEWDYLHVTDAKGTKIGAYTGTELAGTTLRMEGNRFAVRLTSDHSGTCYGFSVAQIVQHKTTGLLLLAQRDVSPAVGKPMAISLNGFGVSNPIYAVQVSLDGAVVDARTTQDKSYIYKPMRTGLYTIAAELRNDSGEVICTASLETSVTEKAFSYAVLEDGGCVITGCASERTGALHLPEVVYGHTVTAIGEGAFNDCRSFTGDLVLPSGLTEIGEAAFNNCEGLTGNLVLPSGLTKIDDYAFSGCRSLTGGLVLPSGLTEISEGVFNGCSGFTGNLVLPSGATSIGLWAFIGCSGLTGNLVLPSGVTTIGESAFYNCCGFSGDLVLPSSLTEIGDEAFYDCNGFTGNLVLPEGLTSIGDRAFWDCSNFTGNLILPTSLVSLGEYAFYNCNGFTGDLVLPPDLTSIDAWAFTYCYGFTGNLVLPTNLTSIGEWAFNGCTGFTGNLVLPVGLAEIKEGTFNNCTGFTSIRVPSSTTEINSLPTSPDRRIPIYGKPGSTAQAYAEADSWNYDFIAE